MEPRDLCRLDGLPIKSIGISMSPGDGLTIPETPMTHVCSWLQKYGAKLQGLGISNFLGSLLQAPALPLLDLAQMESLVLVAVQPNLDHVRMLTQLTELVLKKCGLGDGDVCRLASLSALQCLDLSDNNVKGENGSMEVLTKGMPALTILRLTGKSAIQNAVLGSGQRVVRVATIMDESRGELRLRPLSVAELSA